MASGILGLKKTGVNIEGGATHAYTEAEKIAYVEYLNSTLDPETCPGLPIETEGDAVFSSFSQGVIFPKLIGVSFPDSIDLSKVVLSPKNKFEANQNHDLAIEAARKLGCSVVNIGGEDLIKGTPHLVMGLLWQIIKKALLTRVSLNMDIGKLATGNETAADLSGIPPEQILLRWFNYHLKNYGCHRVVTNFTSDLMDSELYATLFHMIAPETVSEKDLEACLREPDHLARAALITHWADKLNCRKFITARAIVDGNPNLNLAFVATLFNAFPTLGPTPEEKAQARISELETDLFNLDALLGDSKKLEAEYKSALDTAITEKVSLEEELAETTEKFRKLFESNTELIVEKDKLQNQVKKLEEEGLESKKELEKVIEEKDDLFAQLEDALGLGRDFEEKFTKTKNELETLQVKAAQDEEDWLQKLQKETEQKESLASEVNALQEALQEQKKLAESALKDTEEVMQHLEEEIEGKRLLAEELKLTEQQLRETTEASAKMKEELLENFETVVQELEQAKVEHEKRETDLQLALKTETSLRKENELKVEALENELKESDEDKLALLARIAQLEKELAETKELMNNMLRQAAKDKEDALREAEELKNSLLAEAEAERDAELEKVRQLLSGAEKNGWMQLLSKNMAGMPVWKKRFFVLKEGFLTFYKSEKDTAKQKPLGMIDCESTRLYDGIGKDQEDKAKPHVFQIDSGPTQFNVSANSAAEKEEWMTAIRVAKKKKLGVKVVSEETKDQRKARENTLKRSGSSSGSGAISPR